MSELTLVIGDRNFSSWSLRPWLLMRVAGIAFNEEQVRLRQPDSKQNILRHSPSGKAPVLKDGGLVIWDSLAIAEYLAERFPEKSLWPGEVSARAHARAIAAEMHSGFQALRTHLPMDILGNYPGKGVEEEGVATDVARVQEIWRECRHMHAAKGPFLFGAFSIADAMFAPVVTRFSTYGVHRDPVCQNYMDAVANLPAMLEWREGCTPFA